MSAVTDLNDLRLLLGLADHDQSEAVPMLRVLDGLASARDDLALVVAETGLHGPADQTAADWAVSISHDLDSVQEELGRWRDCHEQARAAMRVAEHQIDDVNALLPVEHSVWLYQQQPEIASTP